MPANVIGPAATPASAETTISVRPFCASLVCDADLLLVVAFKKNAVPVMTPALDATARTTPGAAPTRIGPTLRPSCAAPITPLATAPPAPHGPTHVAPPTATVRPAATCAMKTNKSTNGIARPGPP